jgi:YesN/AraC family two-component response regulator
MFRAYFVDDEPLVLHDIINNPLFADYGYQTVGSSTMPIKAVTEIKKLNPDVVFTDLQMPECSGVDLVEKLRAKNCDCEFVVISGYREFDESIRFFHKRSASHDRPSICRLFSGQHGTTFLACLTKLRMEEAARLLRDTKKDVKEITHLCGYDDYFYFCRVFRKHHLCAPTTFREGAK